MAMRPTLLLVSSVLFAFAGIAASQPPFPSPLDPARDLTAAPAPAHKPLPEEYIWTAGDVTALRPDHGRFPWNRPELRIAPHLFRAQFHLASIPHETTLYLAGPRDAHVFLNNRELAHVSRNLDAPIGIRVFHAAVPASALRVGENTLAIEAVRGRGIVAADASAATEQLAYGEVVAVKLVAARFGVEATPLLISNVAWRSIALESSSAAPPVNWASPAFDDSRWPEVQSLGPIESNPNFFQWSADAGMYNWPGYLGLSPHLRTIPLTPVAVTHVYAGPGGFTNISSLTSPDSNKPFTVTNASSSPTDLEAPSLLLDFGREIAGRLYVESASAQDTTLSIAYGESELEALATGLTPSQQGGNYLGTNLLEIPANGIARGPKSGFRYVLIRFLRGAPTESFKTIRAEGIYTPVTYRGSFESSDPLLNRIWEAGAYTTHLCMQDGMWDAVKRDRGRWAGDLDIESRVIADVFGDSSLAESTLRALVPAPGAHVNGIPDYSAAWITTLYGLYSRTGDRDFVSSQRDALLRILATIDASFDTDGLFSNAKHQWLFVDWAPGLYGYTPDSVLGANLQFALAYNRAVQLFRVLDDRANEDKYAARALNLQSAIRNKYQLSDGTFGPTWQINALALLVLGPDSSSALWSHIFSQVKQDAPTDQVISPFFNAYLLDAMADTGHTREALEWMRTYWGGMLAEGATGLWESYDLRWPKTNPHLSLQADGTSGFFVSLAHGWSSGPTAWLQENILGIRDPQNGYRTVTIAPNLAGLDWARGSVPTPHGSITISVEKNKGITLDLPTGVETAFVQLPYGSANRQLYMDGSPAPRTPSAAAYLIQLHGAGHHAFAFR